MNVWAIVPVKPFNRAKSRLSTALSAAFREELAEAMLRRTVSVLLDSAVIGGVLVLSRDNRALVIARQHGARTVQESGMPELNPALDRVSKMVSSWNAEATLILPADLPLVNVDDLKSVVELGRFRNSVVIVPDRREGGTNAILMRPPGIITCQFGEDSYTKHQAAARAAGADLHIFRSERMMLDVDVPEDLDLYREYCKKYNETPIVELPKVEHLTDSSLPLQEEV